MSHHDDHEDDKMKADGKMREMEGKAQAAWGDATDDVSDQAAGTAKEWAGKAQQGLGEVMDEVGDAADKVDGD